MLNKKLFIFLCLLFPVTAQSAILGTYGVTSSTGQDWTIQVKQGILGQSLAEIQSQDWWGDYTLIGTLNSRYTVNSIDVPEGPVWKANLYYELVDACNGGCGPSPSWRLNGVSVNYSGIGGGNGNVSTVASNMFDTVTYAVAVHPSPVPIPAAAWLFGSALLGLGAIKRKKA